MKTIYIRQLGSGNYELSDRKNYTEKFTTKKTLLAFWNKISKELSTTYKVGYGFVKSQIIKTRYSRSQIYFGSLDELYKSSIH